MKSKALSVIAGTILIAVFLAISSNVSASDAPDPKILIGKWEGKASSDDGYWSSDYTFEIFDVDPKGNRAMYRVFCPNCRDNQQWYSDNLKLIIEKGKIFLETPQSGDWSGITFEVKGDKITGSANRSPLMGRTQYFSYSLKRVPEEKKVFEPKELIGQWIWVSGSSWWELTIGEIDAQNKTFKGKYKVGGSEKEHELSNVKIITEGNKLKIDLKTLNDTLHYQLTFYPNFGEYPPVLWGKLERLDGNVFYPMFRKKEKKD
jgi:hypothetical protein